MNTDHDVVLGDAKPLPDLRVEDFRDALDLQIVVARTERSHFVTLPMTSLF